MRAVLMVLASVALAALAVIAFMRGEWLTGTAFLAGALAIVLPVFFGEGFGSLGDAELLFRFVRNPYDTIVDETVDRLTGQDDEPQPARPSYPTKPGEIEYPQSFDADAALQRYLASKAAGQVEVAAEQPAAAPIRTFGRKQV